MTTKTKVLTLAVLTLCSLGGCMKNIDGPDPFAGQTQQNNAADAGSVTDTGTGQPSAGSTGSASDGAQECCVAQVSPGCPDAEIEQCVCEYNSTCCLSAWTAECVSVAASELCSACGNPGAENGEDTSTGDDGAATAADDSVGCTPGTGDCCATNNSPGCFDCVVQSCVCEIDDSCCTDGWDSVCVGLATNECFACPQAPSDCCEMDHLSGGCDDPAVEACVCDLRPECCELAWDVTCVQDAASRCGAGCFVGDCCTPHTGEGCSEPAIEACVCDVDSLCCSDSWHAICVFQADFCPGVSCP